jgi:hypothetical protein
MWVVCGPVLFNADVIMKAQAALLLKASDDHAATLRTAALELADAEALATAPKERRGEKADSTVSGADRPRGGGEVRAPEGRHHRVERVQHQAQARLLPGRPGARVDRESPLRWCRRAPHRGGAPTPTPAPAVAAPAPPPTTLAPGLNIDVGGGAPC